jgi:ATP-binding cassette, subfamily G (WHITE), member 2, PDR
MSNQDDAIGRPEAAESSTDTTSTNSNLVNGTEKVEEEEQDYIDRTATISSIEGGYEPISPGDAAVLKRLATQLSHTTSRRESIGEVLTQHGTLRGLPTNDPTYDPSSGQFDLSKWLQRAMDILERDGVSLKQSGVVLKDVNVYGKGSALSLQATVGTLLTSLFRPSSFSFANRKTSKHILRNANGLVKSGELLIVLGRPGSGCSTFLKTITGEMYGLDLAKESTVHYDGIAQDQMMKEFRGEVVYNQEVDKHFPHLTVGETLEHAAALRVSANSPLGETRQQISKYVTQLVMAVYGLSHTYNTKVGNDFIRGVSGGERKRVSIAEMALAGSPIAAWDNSTRGLDSATALTFTRSLRLAANLQRSTHIVAIYQASQAIYDLFDKATVLYEGRQIFFGPASRAKAYFEEMGWYCSQRQTTGDFLTSVTNPAERQVRAGFESQVPRTASEFEAYWLRSADFTALQGEIQEYESEHSTDSSGQLEDLRAAKRQTQTKHQRPQSPYIVSAARQVQLNTKRAWQRTKGDMASTVAPFIGNIGKSHLLMSDL